MKTKEYNIELMLCQFVYAWNKTLAKRPIITSKYLLPWCFVVFPENPEIAPCCALARLAADCRCERGPWPTGSRERRRGGKALPYTVL